VLNLVCDLIENSNNHKIVEYAVGLLRKLMSKLSFWELNPEENNTRIIEYCDMDISKEIVDWIVLIHLKWTGIMY